MRKKAALIVIIVMSLVFVSHQAMALESEQKSQESPAIEQKTTQAVDRKETSLGSGDLPSGPSPKTTLYTDKAFQSVEKLDVDPATGTATAEIPISVPAGRAGVQPAISLAYNSSSPNGVAGLGWNLEFGRISRSTKFGTPTYTTSDKFVLAQSGSRQELVDVSGNGTSFRPEIEGAFMKIEFVNNTYWRLTDRKGVRYYFGQTSASQVVDPANSAHIFEWCLDKVEDMYGNYMTLLYAKDQNQIYPYQIFYTGNLQNNLSPFATVEFDFENRPDIMFSYFSRFLIKTEKRLSAVKVFVQGALQRKYQFSYAQSPITERSLLTGVTQYGADGISSLPMTTFSYQQSDKGFQAATGWTVPAGARFAEYQQGGRYADLGVRIADVNSDGYPDILKYHEYHWGSPTRETFLHDKNQSWVASPTNWKFPTNLSNFLATAPEIDRGFGVSLSDVNGDGWVDLVRHFQQHPPAAGGVVTNQAFINNHTTGWDYDANWQLPQDGVLPMMWELGQPVYSYHEYTGNLLDDVNGDGFTDYVKSKEDGWGPHTHMTFINNKPAANGWTYQSGWNTQASIYMDFAHGAVLLDLNGDNLKDIMYSKDGTKKVFINNGTTWVEDTSSPWLNESGYTNFNDGSTQCADINGDNMSDLIVSDDNSQKVLLNNGHGWVVDNAWVVPGNLKSNGAKLADVNADGMLDLVKHFNGNAPEVHINKGKVPDLLVQMNNGMGGLRTILYDSACHYDNTFFPFPAQVVKTLTLSSGVGDSYTTTYAYADGLWSAEKRESRGFGYVKVVDPDGNYSESYLLQDDVYKGRIDRQENYSGAGQLFSKTTYQWSAQQLFAGVNFVYLAQKDDFIYDGNATGVRTQEKYFYESSPQYGNLTKAIQMGKVDLSTGNDIGTDKRTAETSYHDNTSGNNWLLGLPKETIVKNNANAQVRKTLFYYDGSSNINTVPSLGQLTKKELWGGSQPGAIDPITEYTYDAYGNLLTTKDPNGHVAMITYDNDFHMFPLQVKNAKNHIVVKEYYGINGIPLDNGAGYHGLWGQTKSIKDSNNQKGNKTYDTFGRPVATVSPLDPLAFPTASMEYEMTSAGAKVITHQREAHGKSGTIDSVSFYDGLGRLIQSKSESGAMGQCVVGGQTEYNSRGLPQKKYLSRFTATPLTTPDPIDPSVTHTTTTYDAMGRAVQTTNPDGTYATVIYDDLTTTAIDENGHKQSSTVDAYGRLVQKQEYTGADGRSIYYPAQAYSLYATTNYSYDSEGNLIQVQDALGNVTTIFYDALGRKIAMDDPDMGYWEYDYDPAGNLIWQKDAKNQVVTFTYDEINRLVNKTDGAALNVNYTYDATSLVLEDTLVDDDLIEPSSAGQNAAKNLLIDGLPPAPPMAEQNYGIGRLTKASYPTADQSRFVYDVLGREKSSTKKIDTASYSVRRSYDAADRLTSLIYPDQSKLVYTYNDAGQIDGIGSTTDNFSDSLSAPSVSSITAKNSLSMAKAVTLKHKTDIASAKNISFKDALAKDPAAPKNTNATIGLSVNPVQPIQGMSQLYTLNVNWTLNPAQNNILFVGLLEEDTGLYLSGAYDWGANPPTTWIGEHIPVTADGSQTIVKNLEAFTQLLGQTLHNFIWRAEVRVVWPGQTYNPNNPGTFYIAAVTEIHTTGIIPQQLNFSATPQSPHPAVLANYDLSFNWAGLPTAQGDDYRLFYTLLENTTGNFYAAAHDPQTGTTWQGATADIPDNSASGTYNASKDLVAYSDYQGTPITSYMWLAQIRRVVPGQVYDPQDPATFMIDVEKTIVASPGTGFNVGLNVNYYHPVINFEKQYEIALSWADPIPTFDDQNYDYKYYVTILDTDSNFLAATTSNGQWWTEMGAITQAAPNTISIVKNLTVQNNDGSCANTDQFTWVGEIRRYPQGGNTTYDVLAVVSDTVSGKDLGTYAYVSNVKYNAAGQILEIEYGNKTKTIYTYNTQSLRLLRFETKDAQGQLIQDLHYDYDSAGNIKGITDTVNTATQTFYYDALNRLTQAQGNYGTKFYQYNQIGNIIQKDNLTFTYGQNGAGPHAVTSLSNGTTFQYDANGNMKKKTDANGAVWDYLYDTENRLTEVKKSNATQAKFYYDGDGGRVKRVNYDNGSIAIEDNAGLFDVSKFSYAKNLTIDSLPAATTTTTKYVGSLYEINGSAPTRYIYLGDTRVAQVQSGQVVYYHGDHLGGTNIVTNNNGVVKELCEYLPFGGFARHEKYGNSAEVAHFYFTGKQLDEKTGLYYYGARYYDPTVGKFLTPDTLIQDPYNPQSLNRYSYCGNNPVNRIDPDGHKWSWKKFWNSFAGAFVGVALSVILGPAGFGMSMAMAGMWGGVAGGALSGGLEGGWKGMLIGAAMGGALGGIGGWALAGGHSAVLGGMFAAGVGMAAATDSWDSFAGGFAGGLCGAAVGGGVTSAYKEQFGNFRSGNGFKTNAEVASAARKSLDVNGKGYVEVYNRRLGGQPAGPRPHPALKSSWDNQWHELEAVDGKIHILNGNLSDMSQATQGYLATNPQPDAVWGADISKFSAALKSYPYEGGNYEMLHFNPGDSIFKYNCIGFENYMERSSRIYGL